MRSVKGMVLLMTLIFLMLLALLENELLQAVIEASQLSSQDGLALQRYETAIVLGTETKNERYSVEKRLQQKALAVAQSHSGE